MAMSAPGEISELTRIASPDIAVITNINPVHLEFFKSLDEIALAKKEILLGAKENGIAVLNGDDAFVKEISEGSSPGERFKLFYLLQHILKGYSESESNSCSCEQIVEMAFIKKWKVCFFLFLPVF